MIRYLDPTYVSLIRNVCHADDAHTPFAWPGLSGTTSNASKLVVHAGLVVIEAPQLHAHVHGKSAAPGPACLLRALRRQASRTQSQRRRVQRGQRLLRPQTSSRCLRPQTEIRRLQGKRAMNGAFGIAQGWAPSSGPAPARAVCVHACRLHAAHAISPHAVRTSGRALGGRLASQAPPIMTVGLGPQGVERAQGPPWRVVTLPSSTTAHWRGRQS